MTAFRLGTRGSHLALTQSGIVRDGLEAAGHAVTLETIRTTGDQDRTSPLSRIGGAGLFTRELDLALLQGRIDLAVHSLKDLPTELEPGVLLAAVPEREDARDVLLGPGGSPSTLTLRTLQQGATVGTGSLRRRALTLAFRPDLRVEGIRGNLDTRIARLDRGDYDAIILAAAGIRRLGLTHRVSELLERTSWLPAPGQGALALVTRSDDRASRRIVSGLDHAPTRAAVRAERTLLAALEGGCQLPIGALGLPYGAGLRLWGLVASPDGTRLVRAQSTGRLSEPEALGEVVASALRRQGADEILKDVADGSLRPLSHP